MTNTPPSNFKNTLIGFLAFVATAMGYLKFGPPFMPNITINNNPTPGQLPTQEADPNAQLPVKIDEAPSQKPDLSTPRPQTGAPAPAEAQANQQPDSPKLATESTTNSPMTVETHSDRPAVASAGTVPQTATPAFDRAEISRQLDDLRIQYGHEMGHGETR